MAWLQKRGETYYACWREPDGKSRKKACGKGEDGRALAKKLCNNIQAQLVLGVYEQRTKNVRWQDFLKEYREKVIEPQSLEQAQSHLRAVERFQKESGLRTISKVTIKDVEAFTAARRKDKGTDASLVSPATINKDLTYIKTMLLKAHEWGYLRTVPPVKMLKVPVRVKSYIDAQEFEAIYAACPDAWWKGFLLFQYMTGWRFQQVLNLTWQNVDLTRAEILSDYQDNKGKRDVLIPLHPVLLSVLTELPKDGLNVFPWGRDIARLYPIYHAIQEKAGIKPRHTKNGRWYGFHDLRRGFATLNAGRLNPFELQKLMMHKDLKTTMRYVDLSHHTQSAIEKIHVPKVNK